MRIVLNISEVKKRMKQHGIKTQKQLYTECGLDPKAIHSTISKNRPLSAKTYWLIADRLDCHVEEIQTADWEND